MHLLFLGLGEGWEPAILESEEEMAFIRQGHRGLSDIRSFYIGGFSDSNPGTIIDYSEYYNGGTSGPGIFVSLFADERNCLKTLDIFCGA